MFNRLIKARLFLSVSRADDVFARAQTLKVSDKMICARHTHTHTRHESDASLCVAETPLLHLRCRHRAKGRWFTTSKPNACRNATSNRINKPNEMKKKIKNERTNNKLSVVFLFCFCFFPSFLVVSFQSSQVDPQFHIEAHSIHSVQLKHRDSHTIICCRLLTIEIVRNESDCTRVSLCMPTGWLQHGSIAAASKKQKWYDMVAGASVWRRRRRALMHFKFNFSFSNYAHCCRLILSMASEWATVMRYLSKSNNENGPASTNFSFETIDGSRAMSCSVTDCIGCVDGSRLARGRTEISRRCCTSCWSGTVKNDDEARLRLRIQFTWIYIYIYTFGVMFRICRRVRYALTTINFIRNTEWSGKWHAKSI